MSFSFRDKPRLSERLRGKSSDQVFEDFEKEFEKNRKMLFDKNSPSWKADRPESFTKAGFPFDEDMPRGHQGIRSHLEDLAQRHPEFAEHLRCPPWGGDVENRGTWGRKRKDSGNEDYPKEQSDSVASNIPRSSSGTQENQTSDSDKESRGQRSSSAPPDGRAPDSEQPQRFVSRININPVNPSDPASMSNSPDSYGKPPVAPKPQSPQQSNSRPTPPKQQSGNVRHIPIFVEGRDEPILPKGVAADNFRSASPPTFSQSQQVPPSYVPTPPPYAHPPSYTQPQQSRTTHTFTRPSQFTSTHQFTPQRQQSPSRSIPIPVKIEKSSAPKPPQAQPQSPQNQQQPSSQPQQKRPEPQQGQGTPPPQPKPQPTDPLSKVNAVRADVEELGSKVEQYSGTSRKDKGYIYLDEMLTRNLLKLDDIDTEGKENVRQARKDVICLINKYIGILESKVPLPEEPMEAEECQPTSDSTAETSVEEGKGDTSTMEVEMEQPCTEPPVQTESEEPQQTPIPAEGETKMELDQCQQASGTETSQAETVNQPEPVSNIQPEVPKNEEETVKQDQMEAEPIKSEETKESTEIKTEESQLNTKTQDKMEVETETAAGKETEKESDSTKTETAEVKESEKETSQPSEAASNTLNPESEVKSESANKSPKSPKKGKGKKSPKKS